MSKYLAVRFDESDSLQVTNIGYDDKPELAHWGPGYRNCCILHYVVKGAGYYNGHKVTENQGFYISSRQLHEYHPDASEPWNYYWIIFSDEIAEKYVLPMLKPDANKIFAFDYRGRLEKLWKSLLGEYDDLSHTQALGFFFRLISLHGAQDQLQMGIAARHVRKAKLYIDNNFNKEITVADVADNIHINERYLYNLFIKYEKISPKEYIDRQRYDLACELLANTHLTIGEIAGSSGFQDLSTFSRFFARKAGVSPGRYRALEQGEKLPG